MSDKVAVLQNVISKGGRFSVISRMIKNLNEAGIIPDLITDKIDFDLFSTESFYGFNIKANIVNFDSYNKHLPEYHILDFNKKINKYLGQYNCVINSSNTAHFLKHPNLLDYVHYPRLARIRSKESLKGSFGLQKLVKLLEYYKVRRMYEDSKYPVCAILANSKFCKQIIHKTYPELENIEVLYPPVQIPESLPPVSKSNRIVSLGRFHPSKKQFELIQLAKQLPEFIFDIVGFVRENDSYVEKCEQYIKHEKLNNVFLHKNVVIEKKNKMLSQASYFIHLLEDEPFGISTVQAISFGCLPIVPDSGGQKEIVTDSTFRFASMEEIPSIISRISELKEEIFTNSTHLLFKHIQKFNTGNFDKNFKKIIKKYVQ